MGIFDNLVKQYNESNLKNEIDKVGDAFEKTVDSGNTNIDELVKDGTVQKEKRVSGDYINFPQYSGKISDIKTEITGEYHRCVIDYEGATEEDINNYLKQIEEAGFVKEEDKYIKDKKTIYINVSENKLILIFEVSNRL